MNLIILTPYDCIGGDSYRVDDNRAEHIITILKLTPGDYLEIGFVNGPQGRGRIESITDGVVSVVAEDMSTIPPVLPEINLICALPRPQTLKKVLITSAMMGVCSLHLVRANRVEKSYFQSPLIEAENQFRYLVEGLAQGKLTRLPEVIVHDRFRPFFEDFLPKLESTHKTPLLKLLADGDESNLLYTVCDGHESRIALAIGPEGGWVPFEIELMQSVGFRRFTLGRWTLRVEHAVTAALSQIELLRLRQSD
ncbi:MAG: 16S rRNA (uracil(1498)-N(3))-methyltransferase [candidate division Zixibacteria bacterium]|nr:16S rRNA (uracil(1498)-N(3))-methyltransferase [candidate division Zixibacteria bacterium]